MMPFKQPISPQYLRSEIIGGDAEIDTPFGRRRLLYADYTASGRALGFMEDGLRRLLSIYANTHTEDDSTGRTMTRLLHEAEARIKKRVNAGEHGRVIGTGSGATGAIQKMQQIAGVAMAPATRARLDTMMKRHFGHAEAEAFRAFCRDHQPVVFVGPYEHHSNEVSWRESMATVLEVRLDAEGGIDLGHLEALLQLPEYRGRPRIGSFSAASNVTGLRSPVKDIASLLHRHGAMAFFDYAASAPYVPIDMNPRPAGPGDDPSIDAIFMSPHKFIGGPGASGILVFNERCYEKRLPPTVAGGGTVDFVGPRDHDFIKDIETREKAGTPGILQIIRAAYAMEVKHAVSEKVIEAREAEMVARAFSRWRLDPNIEILGNPDPARRVGIVSFNIKDGPLYLHPRFVTALLDDLFGVQSRAGCSCAGPYGHALLRIDDSTASRYRRQIASGLEGIKPGWCRVGFHFVFDEAEVDHLIECVEFVARHGRRFLPLYRFDVEKGTWMHRDAGALKPFNFDDLLASRGTPEDSKPSLDERREGYRRDLETAHQWLERLPVLDKQSERRLPAEAGELQYFTLLGENLESTGGDEISNERRAG